LLITLTTLAIGNDDGCNGVAGPVDPYLHEGTDAVTLTLLNDWILAEKALGLDFIQEGSDYYILGVDNNLDIIQAYDPATCAPEGNLPMDPGNGSCFGAAWNNELSPSDAYLTNDWVSSSVYYTANFGSSWTTYSNPASASGRGMDFDGTDYWQTDTNGGSLWLFQPTVGAEEIPVPEVPTPLSGVTVYPAGSDLGVVVAGYNATSLYFYEWDGNTMDFIGSAACPVASLASSFGLAYAEVSDTIFWSYRDASSNYHITELAFDTSALQQSTWGSIKSTF